MPIRRTNSAGFGDDGSVIHGPVVVLDVAHLHWFDFWCLLPDETGRLTV
jgi:hypothetical protein